MKILYNSFNKIAYICCVLFLVSCNFKKKSQELVSDASNQEQIESVFNADSAYAFIGQQVAFGPRVPNSEAHKKCGIFLTDKMQQFCDTVYIQNILLKAYNNEKLQAKNIIGVFNPEIRKRILLFAHWDSRPYSDHDIDERNYNKPIDGADDGASGVGVLLEVARQIKLKDINIGIDIIFFDAEDYGVPNFIESKLADTYCLGSQYWSQNPHVNNYKAEFGILLDMVGSKNAKFYKELYSVQNAGNIVDLVWNTAQNKGYEKYFINENIGAITDDHLYVMKGRNIPCIDIINCDRTTPHGFGFYWHTQQDNMNNISHETLNIVGQVIMGIINEIE